MTGNIPPSTIAMTKKSAPVAKPTYTSFLATCVSASRNAGSTQKTVTKFITGSDESIVTVWSFVAEPHSVMLGQKALITKVRMPDGTLFYNLD